MTDRLPSRFGRATAAWDYNGVVTTWRLEGGDFLKVRDIGYYPSLADERDRLVWAGPRLSVPDVLDYGIDDDLEWLLLSPLPGIDATKLTDDPKWIVPLMAQALRTFHETDPTGCPFDFTNDAAIAHVRARFEEGKYDESYEWHPEFADLGGQGVLEQLERMRPATEDVVLCHGDFCFPNVLFEDGKLTGFLDLGELGLADRWWDVAVGSWSTTWNVGPGYENLFYEAYGVERDPERETFYRLLYSAAS